MKEFYKRPELSNVLLKDDFWTSYTEKIRSVTLPYCFDKFEETGTVQNFKSTAMNDGKEHIGNPFSDGLLLKQ